MPLMSMLKRIWRGLQEEKPLAESLLEAPKVPADGRHSFSQSGEDVIADFVFRAIGVERPTYLDIGAHHPTRLSNTSFFYAQGCRGVNVEPDPDLFAEFPKLRPGDVNLNVGIGEQQAAALPFYVMSTRTLNTFSETEAKRYESTGAHHIESVIEVPVMSINAVIDQHFSGASPDFLTVDVEGLDFEIVKTLDLAKYRPAVICVETITFSETRQEQKLPEIGEYLVANDYFVYADTYINTIFVDRARWARV